MKKILLTIAILLLMVSVGYCFDDSIPEFYVYEASPFTLTIKSDKQVYEMGDEIVLDVEWKNDDVKPINLLYKGWHDGLNLIIENQTDEQVKIFQTIEYKRSVSKSNFHSIAPGECFYSTIHGKIKLPEIFNYPYKTKEEAKGLYLFDMGDSACYFKPGIYEIQYSYQNDKDFYWQEGERVSLDNVWQDAIDSNTITIEVVENKGVSEEPILENANDDLAKITLRTLATASEAYAAVNKGIYASDITFLTQAKPPFFHRAYCNETINGYIYECTFSPDGYTFIARPVKLGETGSHAYKTMTGGNLEQVQTHLDGSYAE